MNEVVRAGLRLLKENELQKILEALRAAVELGSNSGEGKTAEEAFDPLLKKYRRMMYDNKAQ